MSQEQVNLQHGINIEFLEVMAYAIEFIFDNYRRKFSGTTLARLEEATGTANNDPVFGSGVLDFDLKDVASVILNDRTVAVNLFRPYTGVPLVSFALQLQDGEVGVYIGKRFVDSVKFDFEEDERDKMVALASSVGSVLKVHTFSFIENGYVRGQSGSEWVHAGFKYSSRPLKEGRSLFKCLQFPLSDS